jgi:hypothetical protein
LGVRPRNIRLGEVQRKGYYLRDFADAFKRYLPVRSPQNPDLSVPSVQSCDINGLDKNTSVPGDATISTSVPWQVSDKQRKNTTVTDGTDGTQFLGRADKERWIPSDIGEFDD